ncbi:MAG: hypothetical protein Q7J36_03985 [Thiobacillus sp.]|nr:hypothetical protein [Thiobacillus sp.]
MQLIDNKKQMMGLPVKNRRTLSNMQRPCWNYISRWRQRDTRVVDGNRAADRPSMSFFALIRDARRHV